MPPKAKKKGGDAALKRKEAEDLALQEDQQATLEDEFEFQKACLQIRIKELETLNLGLQRKSEHLDAENEVLKVQFKELKDEKEDLVAHLTRCYTAEKTNVKELEDRLYGTQQAMMQKQNAYEKRFQEQDQRYNDMKETLSTEIVELEAKITSLEEFRMEKEKLALERDDLERTLKKERERFQRNYDELENNVIRFREKVKNESIEMVKMMAKDVQEAGKLCLTATVKAAMKENIILQDELEKTSKDNLILREKLDKLQKQCRGLRMREKVLGDENSVLHQKCHQYRLIIQELADRQLLLQQHVERNREMENEFIILKAEHASCLSEEHVIREVQVALEESVKEKPVQETETEVWLDPKDLELANLRELVVQLALACSGLAAVSSEEEFTHHKIHFMQTLTKLYSAAVEIPDLPLDISTILGSTAPDVNRCFFSQE